MWVGGGFHSIMWSHQLRFVLESGCDNYEPTLFSGIEMNPACEACRTPSNETNRRKLQPNFPKADLERNYEKAKPENKIRQRVREKLEVRFKNGEIDREKLEELEEDLVKDLTAELLNNPGEDLTKMLKKPPTEING